MKISHLSISKIILFSWLIWVALSQHSYANVEELNRHLNQHTPNWQRQVLLVTLNDGRLMSIASTEYQQAPTANIWDPKTNEWTEAGTITHNRWGLGEVDNAQAIVLPSGNVLRIQNTPEIDCDLWDSKSNQWSDCSIHEANATVPIEFHKPGIGVVNNTLIVMVTSKDTAFIFNEQTNEWKKAEAKWTDLKTERGAPVWNIEPLMKVFDEKTNTWVDVSGVAGHYWQNNGGPWIENKDHGPSLFWDERKSRWTYSYFWEDGIIGKDPIELMDGCIFSWDGLRLFNPYTGISKILKDPGIPVRIGLSGATRLANGVVVFAGVSDYQPMVYATELSCDGFKKSSYLMWKQLPEQTNSTKVIDRLIPKKSFNIVNLLTAFNGKNLIYIAGMTGFVLMICLIWYKSKKDKATDTFNRLMNAGTRLICYGLVLIFAINALNSRLKESGSEDFQDCSDSVSACLSKDTGLLKSTFIDGSKNDSVIPCKFVGVWKTNLVEHPRDIYWVTLDETGKFKSTKIGLEQNVGTEYTGYWAVQGDYMVWRGINSTDTELDINKIEIKNNEHFVLTEKSGNHSYYRFVHAIPSSLCH